MQEYTKSILHLPYFKIIREPRIEERETAQGIVVREIFHGVLTNEMPGHCKHCGGKLHANQYMVILFRLSSRSRRIF